jgi:hypothetical protein
VAWALWWRHRTTSTTSSKFIIYSGKPRSRAAVLGGAWHCSYQEQEEAAIATLWM